jgi:glycosyltransferase involved in cell wall biosynthesis
MPCLSLKPRITVAALHPLYDTRIANHLETILADGCEVTYVNWSSHDSSLPEGLRALPLVHRRSSELFGLNVLRYGWMLGWFFSKLFRLQPHLIHLHDMVLLPLVPALKLILRSRVVFDVHEHYQEYPGVLGMFARLCYRWALPWVDGLVGVSPSTLPNAAKPSVVIPNYQRRSDFELHGDERDEDDWLNVIYFGSLSTSDRDVELLIALAETMLRQTENVRFKIGGPLMRADAERFGGRFEELAAEFPERFLWFGRTPREEVIRHSATADVGLLLIKSTFNLPGSNPCKVFEYLAVGAAVVATDGFLVAPEIEAAGAGILVQPGVSAEALGATLLDLVRDRPRLERMKRASRELGCRYTWESCEGEYRRLYRKLGIPANGSASIQPRTHDVPSGAV